MAKIANVELTSTFNTWRTRSNESFDRLSQFAINNSSLYANTLTANVTFTSKGLATLQGRATVGTNLTVSGNTTLGAAGKVANVTGWFGVAGRATVSTNLFVGGNTTIAGALNINGQINLGDASTDLLTVTGRASVAQNLSVSGNTILGGASKTLTVGGAGATANVTGWFGVTGRQSISTNLFVAGNTTLGGAGKTQSTTGAWTHTGTASITTNLTVSGNTSIVGLKANNSLGTAGYVLKTNGTSVYWDAAAAAAAGGGGGGDFNTAVSNNNGYLLTDTLLNAFIAASTAGKRYIIRSIHVTNIGDAEATVTGQFDGTTYANTSFATGVPVPVGSSVELFKRPKVLQPSDKIKLSSSISGYLHATIAHEVVTGTSHYGVGADITTSNTYTTLHTATGDGVIESILLTNDDGINDSQARVIWTDGANTIQGYYAYNLVVPAQSTVEILEAPKFLKNAYKVRVYSTSPNRLEAIIAGKNA
jgi:hypothetical protein